MYKGFLKFIDVVFNKYVYLFLGLILFSSVASVNLQNNADYDGNSILKLADNFFRVIAGAGAGGLLTVLVLNHVTRTRASHSYRAIINRFVELSGSTYVDILGNYGHGEFINDLYGSRYGATDACAYIQKIINLLNENARRLEGGKHTCCLLKYDRSAKYIEDLTNIYYRDAINNTTDADTLKELYRCTDMGLKLSGLLEGDFTEFSRIFTLAHFLEVNLELYRILLKEFDVSTDNDIKLSGGIS